MAINKSIIRRNFLFSLGFGLMMGVIFPIYASFFVSYNNETAKIIFTIGCLCAGLAVGGGAFFITRITILKVVDRVRDEMKNLSGKDADLTRRIKQVSNDKLGQLPLFFNKFTEEICRLINLLQNNMGQTQEMSQTLQDNMDSTIASVKQIKFTIAQVNRSIGDYGDHVQENRTSREACNRAILVVTDHVVELFDQMKELAQVMMAQGKSIDGVLNHVQVSTQVIGGGQDVGQSLSQVSRVFLDQSQETLNKDQEAYGKLDSFVARIEDVSSRTNMLAINASIEAARSGKQGQGFKVIAQEIGKLSREAEQLSYQIRQSLDEARGSIDASHKTLEETRTQYSQIFDTALDSLSDLHSDTSQIQNDSHSVQSSYSSVEKLLSVIHESLDTLKDSMAKSKQVMDVLESATGEIHQGLQHITKDAEIIDTVSDSTGKQVYEMEQALEEVTRQVMSFKTE